MIRRSLIAVACAAAVMLVAACGGGDSDLAGHDRPVTEVEEPRPPVDPDSDTPVGDGNELTFSLDTLQVSRIWYQNIPNHGDTYARTSCTGTHCSVRLAGRGTTFSLEELFTDDDTGALSNASTLKTIGGVDVLHHRGPVSLDDGTRLSTDVWGGWMEHSAFAVVRGSVLSGGFRGADVYFSGSLGEGTTGQDILEHGATWTGAMVGIRRDTGQGVSGDARLHFAPSLDIDFTNISGGVPDIRWHSVVVCGANGVWCGSEPVGAFRDSNGSDYIRGNFYGPNAEEVAGIFESGVGIGGAVPVVGAFGASR